VCRVCTCSAHAVNIHAGCLVDVPCCKHSELTIKKTMQISGHSPVARVLMACTSSAHTSIVACTQVLPGGAVRHLHVSHQPHSRIPPHIVGCEIVTARRLCVRQIVCNGKGLRRAVVPAAAPYEACGLASVRAVLRLTAMCVSSLEDSSDCWHCSGCEITTLICEG
jgi:hypothetical protein